MFDSSLDLTNTNQITTIELYPSDYELVLKQLLINYGDRHENNPVFYWNNGYQDLIELNLIEEKLKYNIVENSNRFDTPLALIQQNKRTPARRTITSF